jgi:glycosyltransferase involved in cell wall biosynthesis
MIARVIAMPISSFLPNLGGAEVGLHNIACKLMERGYWPVVMAPAPHVRRLAQDGWQLPYPVEAMPPKIWSLLRRAPWLGFWLLDRFFARMQARHGFDVWHCTMGYPTGVALVHFAQRRPDIRYLIRCAGEDIQRDPEIGYGARLDPKVDDLVRTYLPRAQILTAISDSVADEYRALGVDESRIKYIPNGVDLKRFEGVVDHRAIRARHGLDPDGFLFLSVGRNHPKKNYRTLIEAAALLTNDAGAAGSFQLAVVGSRARELTTVVDGYGLSGRIILIDQIGSGEAANGDPQFPAPELIELYKAADAFVFPSLMETFGVAIVEAMAASLPIIAGDSPGCRDVVRRDRDGLLVPPRDPKAMARAMATLLTDSANRTALAESATARAGDFSWDLVVDDYTTLYDELCTTD